VTGASPSTSPVVRSAAQSPASLAAYPHLLADTLTEPRPRLRLWPFVVLAALGHSALTIAASPPLGWWPFTLIAILPLVWSATLTTLKPGRAGLLTLAGVLPLSAYLQWWVIEVTAFGFIPFLVVQSMWPAFFVWITGRAHRRFPGVPLSIIVPVAWVGVEFVRGELFLNGYAWGLVAHPLIEAPALAAPAVFLGQYFVSFLVGAISGVLADIIVLRRTKAGAVGAAVVAAVWGAGSMLAPRPDLAGPALRVAIVQTNVPQSNKVDWTIDRELEDWKRFEELTVAIAGHAEPGRLRPDIVIWPETMMPGITLEPSALKVLADEGIVHNRETTVDGGPPTVGATAFADRLLEIQPQLGIPMLIGEEGVEGLRVGRGDENRVRIERDRRFNSVYLVHSGRIQRLRYDKVRLTPFGETMPLISSWPWLEQQLLELGARGMAFDLAAGTSMTVFPVPAAALGSDVRIVTPICFEVTVASHCRRLVYKDGVRRADLIANVTNDGWFGNSDVARAQHLQISRWRCLELATPMARAANTGISALIDARGIVLASGVEGSLQRARVDGYLAGELVLGSMVTPYAVVGDVVGWSALVATIFMLAGTYIRGRAFGTRESP